LAYNKPKLYMRGQKTAVMSVMTHAHVRSHVHSYVCQTHTDSYIRVIVPIHYGLNAYIPWTCRTFPEMCKQKRFFYE